MATVTLQSSGSWYLDDPSAYVGGVAPVDGDTIYRPPGVELKIRGQTPILVDITGDAHWNLDSGGITVEEDAHVRLTGSMMQRTNGNFLKLYPGCIIEHSGSADSLLGFGFTGLISNIISYGTQAKPVTFKHTGETGSFSATNEYWGLDTQKWSGSWVNFENIAETSGLGFDNTNHFLFDADCGDLFARVTTDVPFEMSYFCHRNPSARIVISGNVSDSISRYIEYSSAVFAPQCDCPTFEIRDSYIVSIMNMILNTHVRFTNCFTLIDDFGIPAIDVLGNYICSVNNTGNPHLFAINSKNRNIKGNIFEHFFTQGPDSGNCIYCNMDAGTPINLEISSNLVLRNASKTEGSGVLFTQETYGDNVKYRIVNNTITENGFETVHPENCAPGDIVKYANNLLRSYTPNRSHFGGSAALVPDGYFEEVHHNAAYGQVLSDLYGYTGNESAFADGAPGTGDIATDPGLVDETRCFEQWVEQVLGYEGSSAADRNAHGMLVLQAMADPTSEYYDANATVQGLVEWVKAGFVPTNPDYLLGDQTEELTYIGMMEPSTGITCTVDAVGPRGSASISCQMIYPASIAAVGKQGTAEAETQSIIGCTVNARGPRGLAEIGTQYILQTTINAVGPKGYARIGWWNIISKYKSMLPSIFWSRRR